MRLITHALRKEPTRKADKLAVAILGAKPKTNLKASSPSQKGGAGMTAAMPPNATTKKFMRNPIQMMRRAFRKPHTSAMQSFRM